MHSMKKKNVSQSPTTYLKFTRWRHLTCETACITVIQQAVSQVKNLQGVNYQYFVGDWDTFLFFT